MLYILGVYQVSLKWYKIAYQLSTQFILFTCQLSQATTFGSFQDEHDYLGFTLTTNVFIH